ncbi:MAG TPA: DUF721 domain-containing protein [Candidatus Omnitrophota bacterium]|nr:DUF721 domain-containing protein [Candidatus Omnitrophota bacterium]
MRPERAFPPQEPLKGVLGKILSDLQKKGSSPDNQILESWPILAGEKIAGHARPYALKNKTLFVRADSAAWAHELTARHRAVLLKRLQAKFGEETVEKIYFRVGEIR